MWAAVCAVKHAPQHIAYVVSLPTKHVRLVVGARNAGKEAWVCFMAVRPVQRPIARPKLQDPPVLSAPGWVDLVFLMRTCVRY